MIKIVTLLLLVSFSMSAFALPGFLNGERINGMKKYCYYSNGTIITISSVRLCPMRVSR